MIRLNCNTSEPVDKKLAAQLAKSVGISPELCGILVSKGVDTEKKLFDYLHPDASQLCDPFLMKDMDIAAERILKALELGEKIVVYGDYDADGVTSSVILTTVLRRHGGDVSVFLPERKRDGYGLHDGCIDSIIELCSPKLIVTVDCGITTYDEVARAMGMGVDVVITDHHICPSELPPAVACVDPKRPGQDYPFDGLAGVGVTAKLVTAMFGFEELTDLLDILAVGTVADIVPLSNENRAIVTIGLEKLNSSPCPGLRALIEVSGTKRRPVTSGDVGYILAPRINAGGRMDSAMKAYDLLMEQDYRMALARASELNDLNTLRQKIERGITAEAIERIEKNGEVDVLSRRAIVLYSADWDDGVVGIVASRLTERYSRPAILFTASGEEGMIKASGRSVNGIDLHELLVPFSDMFRQFGGHTMAIGVTMQEELLPEFIDKLEASLSEFPEELFLQHIKYDEEVDLTRFTDSFVNELKLMEPVGYGNSLPQFLLRAVEPVQVNTMGQDRSHIRMYVRNGQVSKNAIAFGWGDRRDELSHALALDMVVQANLNRFQGKNEVQLQMKAAYPTQSSELWTRYIASSDYEFAEQFFCDIYSTTPPEDFPYEFSEAIDEVKNSLASNLQGTLIVATSRDHAVMLLNELQDEIESGRLDVTLFRTSDDFRRCNTLLIAPEKDAIPNLALWPDSYLFGLPLAMEFGCYVPDIPALTKANSELRKPEKEILTQVYKYLAQRGISILNTDPARRSLITWCIDVFTELGFANYDGANITIDRNCKKRLLTESRAFRGGQECFGIWNEYITSILESEDYSGGDQNG